MHKSKCNVRAPSHSGRLRPNTREDSGVTKLVRTVGGGPVAEVLQTRTDETLGHVWIRTSGFTLAHFVNDSYPNLYPALLPVLMVDMHFSVALAGLLSSVAALTTQLLQPVTGLLADRFGTRWFVVGGLGLGSLMATSALAFAPAYWVFMVALLVGGLGNAFFHPHAAALVGDLTAKKKGLSMSFFMIGGNIGRALAPVAATTTFLLLGPTVFCSWRFRALSWPSCCTDCSRRPPRLASGPLRS